MCDKVHKVIKKISSLWKTKTIKTSSLVFKIATIYTVFMLLFLMLIIGWTQLFGESASCIKSSGKVWYDDIKYECWIKNDGKFVSFGIFRVVVMLLFHASIFIIPGKIWYKQKKKTISKALKKLPTSSFNQDWITQRNQLIDFITNNPKAHHRLFAIKYISCELLTVFSIILNMLYTCLFIHDFWNEYQQAATSFLFLDYSQFYSESSRIFPRQVTCNYSSYSFEPFTVTKEEVACTFPHNDLKAVIFAIIYIWYIFILTWAVLHLFLMIVLYICKCLRLRLIRRMLGRPATVCECKHLSENGDIGLWFLLRIFRRNMHLAHFQDLCTGLLADPTCPSYS
ncbi:hypothetical protein ACKWTF_003249 [Chironomus riparius]